MPTHNITWPCAKSKHATIVFHSHVKQYSFFFFVEKELSVFWIARDMWVPATAPNDDIQLRCLNKKKRKTIQRKPHKMKNLLAEIVLPMFYYYWVITFSRTIRKCLVVFYFFFFVSFFFFLSFEWKFLRSIFIQCILLIYSSFLVVACCAVQTTPFHVWRTREREKERDGMNEWKKESTP